MNTSDEKMKTDNDDSNDGLRIVIESPVPKRRSRPPSPEISPKDKEIIDAVASELDKELEEKAAKANLSESSVKQILKHVVTNEHVVALVRQAENPDGSPPKLPIFEPKLTRAKAKELSIGPIHWKRKPKHSKVHALIGEDLQEDSSGDEYVPGEDEEEEDEEEDCDESAYSESEPPTPKSSDCGTQTNWTEDGVFKIPRAMTREEEEEANIARRTRSKFSLSGTALEEITETFPPDPDIEHDMEDMCDMDYDDDWKEFLSKFMRPLEEAIKEDEDQDPEYNILAEKEMVDREELRQDRGVKVSKKELNQLMKELFENETFYLDNFVFNPCEVDEPERCSTAPNGDKQPELEPQYTIDLNEEAVNQTPEEPPEEMITNDQKSLLEQQMRQHVQLLTQNFLLLYEHPENPELALKCKEYLCNLRDLPTNKDQSYFQAVNLNSALKVVADWEKKFSDNSVEVQETKEHVAKMLHDCKKMKYSGTTFIPTFPKFLMNTILNSDTFIYPYLLPKIPFRPRTDLVRTKITKSETELIALGLEQFIPYAKQDSYNLLPNGEVNLKHVCAYIQRYMLPLHNSTKLYRHIIEFRRPNAELNPVKYYYKHDKAPTITHFVVDLEKMLIMPPIRRNIDELPYQWRIHLKPELENMRPVDNNRCNFKPIPLQVVSTTSMSEYMATYQTQPSLLIPVYAIPIAPKPVPVTQPISKDFLNRKKRTLPKSRQKSIPLGNKPKTRRRLQFQQGETAKYLNEFCTQLVQTPSSNSPKKLDQHFRTANKEKTIALATTLSKFKFNSSIFKKGNCKLTMLPSMPSLNTPRRDSPELIESSLSCDKTNAIFTNFVGTQSPVETTKNDIQNESVGVTTKDNLDDLNALMIASSTIKPTTKKKVVSTGEKKKAKQLKEMTANLAILSPHNEKNIEEKTNRFVQSYYDKLKEQLEIHEYHRLIEVLNNFEQSTDSVKNLYYRVTGILNPKYPDLAEEFLSFLTASQAKEVGKLVPYLLLNNMSLFLMKLEMYFKDQPVQVKKIYRAISDLSECVDVNMEKISNSILPLLKGNKMLIDWFLQIFPKEKPTESMLNGPWENVDIPKDPIPDTNEPFEIVTLPEYEDPYGGPNCVCSCHADTNDTLFKTRARHCPPCGTRFIQGRVYINTGKGLRQVRVSFNEVESGSDPYVRLGCRSTTQNKRKTDANSPSKNHHHHHHPVKDHHHHHEEIRLSNDSEDDECSKRKQPKGKSARKRKPKPKVERVKKEKKLNAAKTCCKVEKVDVENAEVQMNVNERTEEEVEIKCDRKTEGKQDGMEWDCNTSIESLEMRLTPEPPSAESESGETSQDNLNTDSDSSMDSQANEAGNSSGDDSWTKDEDKTILETLQKEGHKEETFVRISELLEGRSVTKVKSRFQLLMKLIQEMASKKV